MCKGGNGGPQPLEGKQLDLPMGSVSGPGGVQEQELGAPHHGPSSPRLPHPQWMVAMPATWPPAWQHPNMGEHHRFTRGILRGRGKGHSQEPRSRLKRRKSSRQRALRVKRAELKLRVEEIRTWGRKGFPSPGEACEPAQEGDSRTAVGKPPTPERPTKGLET